MKHIKKNVNEFKEAKVGETIDKLNVLSNQASRQAMLLLFECLVDIGQGLEKDELEVAKEKAHSAVSTAILEISSKKE